AKATGGAVRVGVLAGWSGGGGRGSVPATSRMLFSLVMKGYSPFCAATVAVKAIKSVDLPTFGSPTIPHLKPMSVTQTRIKHAHSFRALSKPLRFHSEVHLVLECRVLRLDDHAGIVGDDVAQRFDPGPLRLGEVAEHVRVH